MTATGGPPDLGDLETTAVEAARAGGAVLLRRFREAKRLSVELKGLHDFVTDVDREAETEVVQLLLGRYPDHGIVAEEGTTRGSAAGWRWVIDPLDGTTNFIHGVSTFAVSVALEGPDGLAVGVVHDPFHDETFRARRGGGARLGDTPLSCSRPDRLDDALVATGFPFRELARLDAYLAAFERFVRGTSGLRRAGSAALDLALTACGRYDGFWEIGLSPWDIAAGALLVIEAGGRVTDVGGGPGYLMNGTIVASGPTIHEAMLGITRATLAGRGGC